MFRFQIQILKNKNKKNHHKKIFIQKPKTEYESFRVITQTVSNGTRTN